MVFNFLKKSKIRVISDTARKIERQFFYGNPYFISNAVVATATSKWAEELSHESYDLILGIPRSGMMIASMISLKLAVPLSTPDNFCNGVIWASKKIDIGDIRKILIVDDTASTGGTMREVVKMVENSNKYVSIETGALFVSVKGKNEVDKYYHVMPEPILGEWNLLHQKIGGVGFDMDGVLCEDCPIGSDDNELKYEEFLNNAKPLYIPAYEIDAIITSRLEKYRPQTEAWLKKHGVKYKVMFMWNIPDKKMRGTGSSEYKSQLLNRLFLDYYVESNLSEAEYIWNHTKIPTICIETMSMFNELIFNNTLLSKLGGKV